MYGLIVFVLIAGYFIYKRTNESTDTKSNEHKETNIEDEILPPPPSMEPSYQPTMIDQQYSSGQTPIDDEYSVL